MKKLFILLFGLTFLGTYAQEWCASEKVQAELEAKNPSVRKARLDADAKLLAEGVQKYLKKLDVTGNSAGKFTGTVYEIPVVIHIIKPTGAATGTPYNKTDAEIAAWIDDTNKIYATTYGNGFYAEGTGSDGGTVIPIKLVIAKRDQYCQPTTGIIRYEGGGIPGYDTYGVKKHTANGTTEDAVRAIAPHWPESSYFNIYVINKVDGDDNSGVLGWAGFPTNPDSDYDSFMMSFVVTNRPKTLAHEFGHSMGLYHTFQGGNDTTCPANSDCTINGDKICDTPPIMRINGSVMPTNSDINPCTGALYEGVQYNVMSYGNDSRKFTPGQRDRALAQFLSLRGDLAQSLGGMALPGTPVPPSCVPTATSSGNYYSGPTLVKLGTIDNRTDAQSNENGNQFYIDYTNQQCSSNLFTELTVTDLQNIQVNIRSVTQNIRVWIDYNNNGLFETGELATYINSFAASGSTDTVWNGSFMAPATTVLDTPLRMRVIAGKTPGTGTGSVCLTMQSGQMEDYTVIFRNGMASKNSSILVAKDRSFSIYPNPSNDGNFFIKLNSSGEKGKVEITDASGRFVFGSEFNENSKILKINAELTSGIYFVKVQTGNSIQTGKLIVKK